MSTLGPVNEGTTFRYLALVKDELGAALAASQLSALTLTLYDRTSGTVINGRAAQNVLNANGVTFYETAQTFTDPDTGVVSTYNLEWLGTPADSAIVGSRDMEVHVALFTASWFAGARSLTHEAVLVVTNLAKVPPAA